MGLRFRQSFEVFPGVRLKLSGSGIIASFGVDRARADAGALGSHGISGVRGSRPTSATNHLPPPDAVPRTSTLPPAYAPSRSMREINSALVERLTSHGLVELRDLIAKARSQRKEVDRDLAEAQEVHQTQAIELERRQRSWFRWFMKRRIAELEASVPEAAGEIR